jgi:DNA polymerase-4
LRIACVLITHLRAKAEMRRHAQLKDRVAVIVDRSRARPLVVDSSPGASGVQAGMALQEAISHTADTIVLDSDEPYYRRVFDQVVGALQGVSDRVEAAELGIAYVRIDGLEAIYGGEAKLVCALLNAIPGYLRPRIGIASGKFPSLIAALRSEANGATQAPDDLASFLKPLPVGLLPVPPETRARLGHFGLRRVGDVSALGPRVLQDQFGHEGLRLWGLCSGIDRSPLVPLKYQEAVTEYISLPFYSTSLEMLIVALDTLLKRAYARPQMRDRLASRVSIQCGVLNGPEWVKTVTFKQGVGSLDRASYIVKSRLEASPPQVPIEDVTLTLSEFTNESGVQLGLLRDIRENNQRRLVEVERQLQLRRKGEHALHRVVQVAPWHPLPEMRAVQVPIDPSGGDSIKPLYSPILISVREDTSHRPLAICLGNRWLRVARIEDIWKLDLWWPPVPVRRTYCQVSVSDGSLSTIFHDMVGGSWYQQSY